MGQIAISKMDKPRMGRHPAPLAATQVFGKMAFARRNSECRPYGADEASLALASHDWLAVGYRMPPLPWLRIRPFPLG